MLKVTKRDLTMVPFEFLVVREKFNGRIEDMGDIDQLAASIKENGVKVPMRGYKEKGSDKYYISDGHRRYEACKKVVKEIGQTIYVPFVLEPQGYTDEQRVLDMLIMNEGKSYTPLEKAEVVRRLKAWNYTDKDIAAKIGKSDVYVWKLDLLSKAPKRFKDLIREGRISGTLAMDILEKGPEETEKFLKDVADGKYDIVSENGKELFPETTKAPVKPKITKKDVQPINSFRVFKKVAKDIDDRELDDEKRKFFKWLCRMMNNELTEESIKRFFK